MSNCIEPRVPGRSSGTTSSWFRLRGCLYAMFAVAFMFSVPAKVRAQGLPQETLDVPGLQATVLIARDKDGVPHIFAQNAQDLFFAQGFVHARDRIFQMDFARRQAYGTAAELVGASALPGDVQARTLGVGRQLSETLGLLSPETRVALEAYANGVNASIARQPLPPEYIDLELSRIEPWTALDSIAVARLIAFSLSFDTSDLSRTMAFVSYVLSGAFGGFDGAALLFEDISPFAPFDPAATVPDALRDPDELGLRPPHRPRARRRRTFELAQPIQSGTLELVRTFVERMRKLDRLNGLNRIGKEMRGSNEFIVSGSRSSTGLPLIANDPHLPLLVPSNFYPIQLRSAPAGYDVTGSSFPGTPFVVVGHNARVSWAATVNPIDVTDFYQEKLVADVNSPSGLSTVYQGAMEPIQLLPQVFRANVVGDGRLDTIQVIPPSGTAIPPAIPIVPRRNNGPIVQFDLPSQTAVSVQYTGFGPTRELDAIRGFNLAESQEDFVAALQNVDVGAQNFVVADVDGNIAYYGSGELPLREDLDAGAVVGLPPFLLRDGQGGNEWIIASESDAQRASRFAVLPFEEFPTTRNPELGFIVNANNDPGGGSLDNDVLNERRPDGGIRYLSAGYAVGVRAGRITRLLEAKLQQRGKLRPEDLEQIQADVVLGDAQVLAPFLVQAFVNARREGAPALLRDLASTPRIQEAIVRLAFWDRSTPTGVPEGFDASDSSTELAAPSSQEIAASVAATLYSTWRTEVVRQVFVEKLAARGLELFSPRGGALGTLRRLLENFETTRGVGASGIDFFAVSELEVPEDARDFVLLSSMARALDRLASDEFALAFGNSTEQQDYRWGLIHRLILPHPLGGRFNIPPAGGAFPEPTEGALKPGLAGFAVDGGLFTVDVANPTEPLPMGLVGHRFTNGPNRRFVAQVEPSRRGFRARTSLPGGVSGVLGSPFYANLLRPWLTNDAHPLLQQPAQVLQATVEATLLQPARIEPQQSPGGGPDF